MTGTYVPLGTYLEDGNVSYGIVQPGADETEGVPIVRAGDIRGGAIDTSSPLRVEAAVSARHARTVLQGGELLFSVVGSVGETALVPSNLAGWNVARAVAVLRTVEVNSRWLHYFLGSPDARQQVDALLNTTVQPTLNLADLKRIRVPVMPPAEQQAIAEVLGALDDKIAANTALAATARELGVAMLRIEASMTALGNVVLHHKRQINPASMDEAVVEHYSLPAFDDGRGPEMVPPSSIKSSKFAVDTSAVLVSKLNPQTPRVWPINVGLASPRLASTEFLVLEPLVTSPWVLWGLLSQPSFTTSLQGLVAGTSGSHQRVRPEEVLTTLIVDPRSVHPQLLTDVEEVLAPIDALLTENRTLSATRDALLPQLMSGSLRVRDAEAAASEAGV